MHEKNNKLIQEIEESGYKFYEEIAPQVERLMAELQEAGMPYPDPEIMEQHRVFKRRKQLTGLYKQHYRYLPEFEQAYRIFEEEWLTNNPT